jgi:hypothetical protein
MDEALNTLVPDDDQPTTCATPCWPSSTATPSSNSTSPTGRPTRWSASRGSTATAVGIIANQPLVMSGCLDINASDKIARHITLCDQFNIPLITFVDCPGYLPGVEQEYNGVIRHGAKIIYAYCQATVPQDLASSRARPWAAPTWRMSSKQMNNDVAFAWPSRPRSPSWAPRAPRGC